MKKLFLTKNQAQAAYTIFKTALDIGGRVEEVFVNRHDRVTRYAFDAGYGVTINGRTIEDYATLEELGIAYGII